MVKSTKFIGELVWHNHNLLRIEEYRQNHTVLRDYKTDMIVIMPNEDFDKL